MKFALGPLEKVGDQIRLLALDYELPDLAEIMRAQWELARARKTIPEGSPYPPEGDLLLDILAQGMFRAMLPSDKNDEITERSDRLAPWLLRWAYLGTPTFNVTASAEAAWLLTDCTDLRWSEIHLPFDAMMIRLPGPSAITLPGGEDSSARAIIIRRSRAYPKNSPEAIASEERFRKLFRDIIPGSEKWNFAEMCPRPDGTSPVVPTIEIALVGADLHANMEGLVGTMRWVEEPDKKLEEWFDRLESVLGPESAPCMQAALRVLVGLCLYLDHLTAEEKWSPAPKAKKTATGPVRLRWCIGNEIKLPREVREAAADFVRRKASPAQWVLKGAQIVRGHHQRYHVGKCSDRKVIRKWKMPYRKGEDGAKVAPGLWKTPKVSKQKEQSNDSELGRADEKHPGSAAGSDSGHHPHGPQARARSIPE